MSRPHFKLKPRLETIAQAPNLWYPDGNPDKQKSDTTFYDALDLPILRDSILSKALHSSIFPKKQRGRWDRDSNPYADVQEYFDLIFQDGHFNPDLANYRLDIMQHLRTDNQARQTLENLFNGLAHMVNLKETNREEGVLTFLKKGKIYCDIVQGYKPFSASTPDGLQRVNQHFEAVQASGAYRKLEEIVEKTKNGFHLQMTWNCTGFLNEGNFFTLEQGHLEGKSVVSAAIMPLNEKVNEFSGGFELNYFNRRGETLIEDIIAHAIKLKFKRHFANAQEQIRQTLNLFPQVAIYLADLKYMEEQEQKGVHYTRPIFLEKEDGRASFKNVHHPLVTERSTSVGNPVEYNSVHSIAVITGPNKGGKSVYVKAVGIAHARGMKGFFVPAEKAEFSARDGIYTHFIKSEDIMKGESRFSDEMKRMESIFSQATPYSLVLLDEPCGGTTLSAGETKTQEFLEVFGELGCPVFITTHMEGIAQKVAEGNIPKSLNRHLSFSNNDGRIEYHHKLIDGPAKMDYGVQIADSLGLSADNLRQLLKKRSEKEDFKFS